MYKLRLQILIGLFVAVALICLFRLADLQLFQSDQYRKEISEKQILKPQPLPTLRGQILDRKGAVLAKDVPSFYVLVNYQLTRLLDDRFWQGMVQRQGDDETDPDLILAKLKVRYADDLDRLSRILDFGTQNRLPGTPEITDSIARLNDRLWEMGRYVYWRRTRPTGSLEEYQKEKEAVEPVDVLGIRLWEMYQPYPVFEISPDLLVKTQIELGDLKGVEIRTQGKRYYPQGSAACQIIGWVGLVQDEEKARFSHDEYLRYLEGELIGKAGIEQVCEPILRGRRGEVIYNKDGNLLRRKEPQYGCNG